MHFLWQIDGVTGKWDKIAKVDPRIRNNEAEQGVPIKIRSGDHLAIYCLYASQKTNCFYFQNLKRNYTAGK